MAEVRPCHRTAPCVPESRTPVAMLCCCCTLASARVPRPTASSLAGRRWKERSLPACALSPECVCRSPAHGRPKGRGAAPRREWAVVGVAGRQEKSQPGGRCWRALRSHHSKLVGSGSNAPGGCGLLAAPQTALLQRNLCCQPHLRSLDEEVRTVNVLAQWTTVCWCRLRGRTGSRELV